MNAEIKNYIIKTAKANGFEIKTLEIDYIVLCSDYETIAIEEIIPFGNFYFELWNEELVRELVARFIIPESLDDLKELFRILKIFEQ